MNKQDKIDSMVSVIMEGEQIPIIFDPYKNATDCMILWKKFSLGQFVEIGSYAVTNDWVARRLNKRNESNLKVAGEGGTMLEAMCECMFKASKKDVNNANVNYKRIRG